MRPCARNQEMATYDFAIIGSGPAGHGAAIQAAKLGKRVAVIDRREALGGTSVTLGSIPSKTLREAVLYFTGFRQRAFYGIDYVVKPDLSIGDLSRRCDQVVRNESAVIRHQLQRNGVDVLMGDASFQGPHRLLVHRPDTTLEVEAEYIVIAAGSVPASSEKIPVNQRSIINSDGVPQLTTIPKAMTVVGAGVIGMEFACMFAALGTEVTIVDQRYRAMEFLDDEVYQALVYQMRQQGVIFRLGEEVTEVVEHDCVVVAHTSSHKKITSDVLLYSVGRVGATASMNLSAAGVEADSRGRIPVNADFQTQVPHIYAVGDVVGFPALAATSWGQGRVAARHALGLSPNPLAQLLPFGLYTIPEISMVGETELQLTRANISYEIGVARYRETARGQIIGDNTGFLKLLVDPETRRILGIHVFGEGAAELVHIGQIVMALKGTLDVLLDSTFNHPTLSECYRIAALDADNKLE